MSHHPRQPFAPSLAHILPSLSRMARAFLNCYGSVNFGNRFNQEN
jgi:hypothetical protein